MVAIRLVGHGKPNWLGVVGTAEGRGIDGRMDELVK